MGLSVADFSRRSSLCYSTISKIDKGKSVRAHKLAHAVDILNELKTEVRAKK